MNSHGKSPLYFNLSQINGFNQLVNQAADLNTQIADLEVYNTAPFLVNANNYFIGIMRAVIPTSGLPKLIVPVLLDGVNTNPAKLLYIVSLAWRNPAGDIIYSISENVILQPEEQGGQLPLMNTITQDFTTNPLYYQIYDPNTLLLSINDTIRDIWGIFCNSVLTLTGIDLISEGCIRPYFGFNESNNKFTFNSDVRFFNQDKIYNYDPITGDPIITNSQRAEVYIDGLLEDLLQVPSIYLFKNSRYGNQKLVYLVKVNNDGTQIPETGGQVATSLIIMTAWKSSLNNWNAVQKILFTINYGIPTKLEYENLQNNNEQQQTTKVFNPVRPLQPILTDIVVDYDTFAVNNNYIQFNASGITQIRLIDITTQKDLQNFSLKVSWVDSFSNVRDLIAPTSQPISVKVAFFPKSTTII